MQGDLPLFMRQLIRRPHQVVALAPSSRALTAEMVAGIDPKGAPVIELGAGTGRFTAALLALGLPPERLHAIEFNPEFCAHLRTRFPDIHVHEISAGDIGTLPVEGVQAVVSGLPLLSMPVSLQRAILGGTCEKLEAGGTYVQFTYGPKPPVARDVRQAFDLTWTASGKIWWNLPPARVYRFRPRG